MKAALIIKYYNNEEDLIDIGASLITLEDKVCCVHVQYAFKTMNSYSMIMSKNCSEVKFDHIVDMFKSKKISDFYSFSDKKERIYSKANKIYASIAKDVGVDVKWYDNEILV